MLHLAFEEGEVEVHGECGREMKAVLPPFDHDLRDLDRADERDTELALEVAGDRGNHEGSDRESPRDAARKAFDARDVVVRDEVVEPFPIDVQCKCCNGNVVDPHE
jgi:hypothetical protein